MIKLILNLEQGAVKSRFLKLATASVKPELLPTVSSKSAATFDVMKTTISKIQSAYQSGDLTAVKLVQLYLNRIDAYDRSGLNLNAVPVINPNALADAAELDRLRFSGSSLGPLHGIPVLIKDSMNVAGLATTVGFEQLKSLLAPKDSFIVQQFRKAGAIILGKTNLDTLSAGDGIGSHAWGRTLNPYDVTKTTGGSSTGSATALAANFAVLATGGETGGSIRTPAHNLGLVGLKPSRNLISTDGTFPFRAQLDTVGPMGRTVTDVAIAMDALVADDPNSITAPYYPKPSSVRPESYTAFLDQNALRGKKIGLIKPYIGKDFSGTKNYSLQPNVQKLWDRAVGVLQAQGATVLEIDYPFFHNWYEDTLEGKANGRETYGLKQHFEYKDYIKTAAYYFDRTIKSFNNPDITSILEIEDFEPLEPTDNTSRRFLKLKQLFQAGEAGSFEQYNIDKVFAALDRWREQDIEALMEREGIDVFAYPTTPYAGIEEYLWNSSDKAFEKYGTIVNSGDVNWLGLPAITVPMGFTDENMPATLTFMSGKLFEEAQLIGYAYDFEQATQFRRSPSTTPALLDEYSPGFNKSGFAGDLAYPEVIELIKQGKHQSALEHYIQVLISDADYVPIQNFNLAEDSLLLAGTPEEYTFKDVEGDLEIAYGGELICKVESISYEQLQVQGIFEDAGVFILRGPSNN